MLASAAVDAARHVISAAWPLHPVLCWLGGGTSIARTLSRSEGEYDAMHLASAAAEIHRSDGVEFVLTGAEPSWAPWLPGSCALVAVDERERLNRLLPLPNSGTGAPGASGRKPSPITAREELPDPLLRPSDPDAHFGATLSHLPARRGGLAVMGTAVLVLSPIVKTCCSQTAWAESTPARSRRSSMRTLRPSVLGARAVEQAAPAKSSAAVGVHCSPSESTSPR
mmetsp:Transcript_8435/g.20267  ORF Transcript_8435/g.20267 Transcript_8435/m.20267 type:complete len:225 (-) Transcript_8435:3526-4200(-)